MQSTPFRLQGLLRAGFRRSTGLAATLLLIAALAAAFCQPERAQATICAADPLPSGTGTTDLVVIGTCHVKAGTYKYKNVNVVVGKSGSVGKLIFDDAASDFWAQSILVQNGAFLWAGTADGTNISPVAGPVTIHLWGKDNLDVQKQTTKNTGIPCVAVDDTQTMPVVTEDPQCGVPDAVWKNQNTAGSCTATQLSGGVTDCFYPYMAIDYDDGDSNAYFGIKVLGVSYGGTLQLYGARGATYPQSPTTAKPDPLNVADSGRSWARLNKELIPPYTTLVLDRVVKWQKGDWIVVSPTDYLPGHAEQVQIAGVQSTIDTTTLTLASPLKYPHSALRIPTGAESPPAARIRLGRRTILCGRI
jgi:hypothetical protein